MIGAADDDVSGDCVVDASVGIKLFLVGEEHAGAADALFDRLAADPPARFFVPDLFYAECANVLWKYVRAFHYPATSARQDVADLLALNLETVSAADLLMDALDLALHHDLTVYDGCYASLARQLALPLVTADAVLARKLAGSGLDIHLLADLA
jgi:predicted nucleic acid-binding protein